MRRYGTRSSGGLTVARTVTGLALALLGLPALTAALVASRSALSLASVLLVYLLAVVAVAVAGGLGPALLAAVASFGLANFYLTPPYHTFRIEQRDSVIALVVFVVVASTVAAVVELAARRRVMAARDRQAAELRTALLAAVGHDLRTPLAGIKAAVSSLRQDDVAWSAADTAELLAAIEESADRLAGLVANLLDMSRLQAGVLAVELRPVALDEVVARAMVEIRGGDLRGGDVRVGVAEDLPLVRADAGLLERTVANLLTNARRHTPDGTPVQVTARAADGLVRLAVVDAGPGIAAADRARAFAPFQRLDDRRGGVGLGLAIARGFTEAMGGTLAPSDTPGGGLTMTITLPVARTTVPR
ncbi:MAG TPA: ATP-binding protein [Mycobacteriales bacterium]|nr:ATP-binding protein [Mycobacteriales bacterium]